MYEIATDDVHDVSGCDTCHHITTSPNDGTLKGSASGAVSGDGCTDCHSTYFDGHGHDHSGTGTGSVLDPLDTST